MTQEFELSVHVPADEWAESARRLRFLEALVIRLARETSLMREWYSAEELASLRLPGIPATRNGVAKRASARRWQAMRQGSRLVYHVSSLPGPAFDCLISRILDLPADIGTAPDLEAIAPPAPPMPKPDNTAPAWVLPLMRLIRTEPNLGSAWAELPRHLPKGTTLPTIEEAAETLVRLGLA